MVTVCPRAAMSSSVWGRRRNTPLPSQPMATDPSRSHPAAPSLFVIGLSAGNLEAPGSRHRARFTCKSLVDRRGVEPLTSAVQILTNSLH